MPALTNNQITSIMSDEGKTLDIVLFKKVGYPAYDGQIASELTMMLKDPSTGKKWVCEIAAYRTAVRMSAHKRNVQATAKRMGLSYWPALILTRLKVNHVAYLIAEDILAVKAGGKYGDILPDGSKCRGGWDFNGAHGASPRQIANWWLLSGAKDCPKFRWLVSNHRWALKQERLLHKSHSLEQVISLVQTASWLDKQPPAYMIPHGISSKAILALGKLSPPMRWAALYDVRGSHGVIRIRDLNWDAAAKVQSKEVPRQHYLPPQLTLLNNWWKVMSSALPKGTYLNGVFVDLNFPDVRGQKVAAGTVKYLMKGVETAKFPLDLGSQVQACINLARLFGKDVQSIERFIPLDKWLYKQHGRIGAIHDGGQVRLPPEYFSPVWGKLVLTKPTLAKHLYLAAKVEEYLGHAPSSVQEALEAIEVVGPPPGSEVLDNMTDWERGLYTALQGTEKTWEEVPAPGGVHGIQSGAYSLVQLKVGDLRAPAAGILTDCCQHMHGAAASCARQSYQSPMTAIWAVFKDAKMVAQSFIWKNAKGSVLVMDSVECLSGHYNNEQVAAMFVTAASSVIGKLGVRRVVCSTTSYGMTQLVNAQMGDARTLVEQPKPGLSLGYSDCSQQVVVLAEGKKQQWVVVPAASVVLEEVVFAINTEVEDSEAYCEHCGVAVHESATICWRCGGDVSEWTE